MFKIFFNSSVPVCVSAELFLPSYNSNQVDAITVQIPIIKEQIKIGKFMSDIDNLITLHQRE